MEIISKRSFSKPAMVISLISELDSPTGAPIIYTALTTLRMSIKMIENTDDIIAAINSGGDRTVLVGASQKLLSFENQSSDADSFGMTEAAFDFINPLFIQVPPVMDDVRRRICDDHPPHLADFGIGGTIFEFFEIDYRSTGGQIIFHLYGDGQSRVDSADTIETIIGYVVAESVVIRRSEPVSGNRLR